MFYWHHYQVLLKTPLQPPHHVVLLCWSQDMPDSTLSYANRKYSHISILWFPSHGLGEDRWSGVFILPWWRNQLARWYFPTWCSMPNCCLPLDRIAYQECNVHLVFPHRSRQECRKRRKTQGWVLHSYQCLQNLKGQLTKISYTGLHILKLYICNILVQIQADTKQAHKHLTHNRVHTTKVHNYILSIAICLLSNFDSYLVNLHIYLANLDSWTRSENLLLLRTSVLIFGYYISKLRASTFSADKW